MSLGFVMHNKRKAYFSEFSSQFQVVVVLLHFVSVTSVPPSPPYPFSLVLAVRLVPVSLLATWGPRLPEFGSYGRSLSELTANNEKFLDVLKYPTSTVRLRHKIGKRIIS